MPLVGFEPTIPASGGPQTLDRVATGIVDICEASLSWSLSPKQETNINIEGLVIYYCAVHWSCLTWSEFWNERKSAVSVSPPCNRWGEQAHSCRMSLQNLSIWPSVPWRSDGVLCPFFWSGPTSADTCCGPEVEAFVGWVRPGVSVFQIIIHMLKKSEIVMRDWILRLLDRSSEGFQELLQSRRWGQVRSDLSNVTAAETGFINRFIANWLHQYVICEVLVNKFS